MKSRVSCAFVCAAFPAVATKQKQARKQPAGVFSPLRLLFRIAAGLKFLRTSQPFQTAFSGYKWITAQPPTGPALQGMWGYGADRWPSVGHSIWGLPEAKRCPQMAEFALPKFSARADMGSVVIVGQDRATFVLPRCRGALRPQAVCRRVVATCWGLRYTACRDRHIEGRASRAQPSER